MVEIKNLKIYDLKESVIACRNAMRSSLPQYTDEEFEKSLHRAINLCKSPTNSGHCNFLSGIRVSFDITYPQYISPELQRYHWIDIVTSASKMHKLGAHISANSFNKYVDDRIISIVQEYAEKWLKNNDYDSFIRLVSNTPLGLELFMRVSTNYLQLRNLYHQRKNHKLKEDWGTICKMIESLPYFKEFIGYE